LTTFLTPNINAFKKVTKFLPSRCVLTNNWCGPDAFYGKYGGFLVAMAAKAALALFVYLD
jgi:hypothetical protein